ncbi:MAG: chorismate mutase [Planctomycetes bacterium]|nr:chorismate mutase [Planctomycetota bacterium]
MPVRGIRGAIVCTANTEAAILSATTACLTAILEGNSVAIADIASAFFSVTPDLNAAFPAAAARAMGLSQTPLLCLNEIDVPGGLARCIRILVHVNTTHPQAAIQHVYLGDAKQLRPDHNV